MATLFISDLHLHASRPSTTRRFLEFLESIAASQEVESLYILGDFFEVWLGDDNDDPHDREVIEALANYTQSGRPVYFMQGNRDFLIGPRFAKETGCVLIPDPSVIDLYGEKILLLHGDSLCTLDKAHQRFRKIVRHPFIQWLFLRLPLSLRQKIATGMRSRSQRSLRKEIPQSILAERFDVTKIAVTEALTQHHTRLLIHGHTHKPGIHEFKLNQDSAKRIVLGEWGALGHVLIYSKESLELKSF